MDAYAHGRKPLTHRQTLLIVLGVLLPTFMGSLDQTILATALPTIGRDFGDTHNLPWLITAYMLAATAVIPLYGKVADIHGRRFTLRIAILTYMAGSRSTSPRKAPAASAGRSWPRCCGSRSRSPAAGWRCVSSGRQLACSRRSARHSPCSDW